MFRFTITELKYRTLSVRKTWRSFPNLLPQMSYLSQSVKGKMIFQRLDPVWSPGSVSPRVKSNDGTVWPKFDSVWSPQIRSAKIIQPNAMPKLKLPRLTKWSPIIILALPLLLRKCCSVPLESECVFPCNLGTHKKRVFKGMLVSQFREHRCRNKCFVHSKQSHRRKRNREPSRILKRKLVCLYSL